MRKYKRYIVVLYDTDEAGVNATKRAIKILEDAGFIVYCTNTKPSKDPDEFLRSHSASEMKQKLQCAVKSTEYIVRHGDIKEAFDSLLNQVDPKDYRRIIGE